MKSRIPSDPKVYLPLVLLMLVLMAILPRTGRFKYDYQKGSPWNYETLIAQFDFPLLKTPEEITSERDEAFSSVIPYYRYSESVYQGVLKSAESLSLPEDDNLRARVVASLSEIYGRGVMTDGRLPDGQSPSEGIVFIQRGKRAAKYPASEVYTVSTAKSKLLADVHRSSRILGADSLLSVAGVYDLIVPNLVYDKETTELVHAETANYISPTQGFVSAGERIVSRGEIVTAEIQQMLDSYKAEYRESLGYAGPRIFLWLGNGIIALALCLILFLSILYTNPRIFQETNRYLYIVFIVMLAAVLALVVNKINANLLYMVPFSLIALYLLAFFRKRVVLTVYIVSLLPLLIFTHNGIELFVMNLVSGVVTMFAFQYFNRGWRQFLTALIAFVAIAVTYLGFRMINDVRGWTDMIRVLYMFIGAILSVALYTLIFLFEKVFMLVSNSRLMELCDTNGNKLLVEMSQKAPGTFQHSLQVMNMAEAAARSIDANVLLVRAGALYHDIGKTVNPQCFIENETLGSHYHAELSAKESAHDILRHVPDGVALAEKYGLPAEVKDFILTHHGTSFTGFFYNKYVNEGGDPADMADFRYAGVKPTSKEQSIVMICDTLEAASRTLKDNKPETFDAFVEKMISIKMDDGQLEHSEITLKELNTIKALLKSYLAQVYHDRVVYPDRKK